VIKKNVGQNNQDESLVLENVDHSILLGKQNKVFNR